MDSVFFVLSKVFRIMLSPTSWLLMLGCVAWLLYRWHFVFWARWVSRFCVMCLVMIGFYPIGQWLLYPLESYSTQLSEVRVEEPDGIIVLGGAWILSVSDYWQQPELNHAADRELAFMQLAQRYPNAKLVFTGGSGQLFKGGLSEASFARQLHQSFGLNLDRIVYENQSRNTYENAVYSKQLVNPDKTEQWWLVTSAFHMPRSRAVFCQQGWSVTPYPVDYLTSGFDWKPRWNLTLNLGLLEKAAYEWFGLLIYRLTGKIDAFFVDSEC